MATGGYGRGGRGAALLQALKTPARKPGESPSPTSDEGSPPVSKFYTNDLSLLPRIFKSLGLKRDYRISKHKVLTFFILFVSITNR